jgi:hypothetical protein
MRTKTWILGGMVTVSVLMALYEGVLSWHGLEGRPALLSLCGTVFVYLLVLWVDTDAKEHPEIYRPFEYGYLVLLWWVPYVPYYLWRTRGAVGLLMFLGFTALYLMAFLIQWLVYVSAAR